MKPSSLTKVDIKAILNDFQNLNPKDVGAWPLAPRIAVLLGLFVLILLGGWWFWWNEQLETLTQRQQDELKLKEEFVAKKTQAVNLDLYVQQLNEIDRSFGALLKLFLKETNNWELERIIMTLKKTKFIDVQQTSDDRIIIYKGMGGDNG